MTLHRKCVMGTDGAECKGDPIMTKPCNKDPCPPEPGGEEEEEEVQPLTVKIMRFS